MGIKSRYRALTNEAVEPLLRTKIIGRTLLLLEETPSTNTEALRLAQEGVPDGTTVVAERQTAGRGRLGRQWYSPPGENLYCSVLLRQTPPPDRVPEWLPWVPLTAAIAAAHALATLGKIPVSLKWPNDLLIETRKLGGILCESGGSGGAGGKGLFVVVGIGINVNIPAGEFPEELSGQATSLAMETGVSVDRAMLLGSLLNHLETWQGLLLAKGPRSIAGEYTSLSSTLGQRVRAILASGETLEGRAEGIGPDGALQIRTDPSRADQGSARVVEVRDADVVHLR